MSQVETAAADPAPTRPETTLALSRGVCRLMADRGYAPLLELPLGNGRRADVAALGPQGDLWIVEVKSCLADFTADHKWQDYLPYADAFYFAVSPDFPAALIPDEAGLITADRFGGAILRQAPVRPLSGGRRKALTLSFARLAAARLLQAPPG